MGPYSCLLPHQSPPFVCSIRASALVMVPSPSIYVWMFHHFEPVHIWEKVGMSRAIGDVERATEWLLDHWPPVFADTPAHLAARMACLEAWEDRVPAEHARAAFKVAAEEAGILVSAEMASRPGKRRR
jgi:hypothetical protein